MNGPELAQTGMAVPVDAARLLRGIVIALDAPPSFEKLVRQSALSYGIKAPVRRSKLARDPIWSDMLAGRRMLYEELIRSIKNETTSFDHCGSVRASGLGGVARAPAGRRLLVDVRAYDDGVAFRYRTDDAGPVRLLGESTAFVPAGDPECLVSAADGAASFTVRELLPLTQTTRGQALAMYVVYDRPLQMVSDDPDAYRNAAGFDFIKRVPTAWDETRFLSGTPGRDIVLARRQGKTWYVGAMQADNANGGATQRLPLRFLSPGKYRATVWEDGATPNELVRVECMVTAGDVLELHLASAGGAAVILEPR
jgi:hypothetical protein